MAADSKSASSLRSLPQLLLNFLFNIVTSPHFEKVRGVVGIVGKCVGVWGEEGGCGKRYKRKG